MLAAVFACAVVALPPQLQGVHRIVALGDSITQGGAGPRGYVTLIANAVKPIEIVNAGISGHKATDMAARFQKDVLDKKPDLVTISVGVNDVWHNFNSPSGRVPTGDSGQGVSLPLFVENVDAMIQAAQAAKAQVLLLSPTLVYEDLTGAENKRVEEYVRAGEKLAKARGVRYVNLYKGFHDAVSAYQKHAGTRSLLLTTDGVHLNDAGNALMAAMILKALGVPAPQNGVAK